MNKGERSNFEECVIFIKPKNEKERQREICPQAPMTTFGKERPCV